MRHSFLAIMILAAAACVDVPDSVRAEFAGPAAADRSNYRPGTHGSAPPVDEPTAAKAAEPAAAAASSATTDADASSEAAAPEPSSAGAAHDGGAP